MGKQASAAVSAVELGDDHIFGIDDMERTYVHDEG
jgi:hypothetical protein